MSTVASLVVKVRADISGLTSGLQTAERDVTGFGGRLSSAGKKAVDAGKQITGALLPVGGAVGLATKAAIDFESQFADVAKTVGGTDEDLADLSATLREMATDANSPVSALENASTQLTGIAAAAGALGVERENLETFTEQMAMMGVATDATAEEAAVFSARFSNVTGMDFSNLDEMGDVIVTLGNNMAATESEIMAFAQRLAPLAEFDWDEEDILAYSGALASLGVSSELGSTNLFKSVSDLTTAVAMGGPQLEGFADIAGMTADEFKRLADNNPEAAFNAFIKGLGELDASEQILQLDALGITSNEQISTLQRLAGGYDTLTQALDLAEQGWAGNNAVLIEAEAKADTTAGTLNRAKNNLNDLAITMGNAVTPALNDFLNNGLIPMVAGINDWAQANPEAAGSLMLVAGVAAVAGPALVVLGVMAQTAGVGLRAVSGAAGLVNSALGRIGIAGPLAGAGLALTVAAAATDWEGVEQGIKGWGNALRDLSEAETPTEQAEALDKLDRSVAGVVASTGPGQWADGFLQGIEKLTGVQLPDVTTGIAAWGDNFRMLGEIIGNAWSGVVVIFDSIKRGFEMFFMDIEFRILDQVAGFRQTILDATGGTIDIAPTLNVARAEGKMRLTGMQYADAVTQAINEQLASGEKIDLGEFLSVASTTGFSQSGALSGFFNNPEVIAGMGEAGKRAVEDALQVAFSTADVDTAATLLPVAANLGITLDQAQIQGQIVEQLVGAVQSGDQTAYFASLQMATSVGLDTVDIQQQVADQVAAAAAAATPSATVGVEVSAAVTNIQGIIGSVMAQVQSAISGSGIGAVGNAVGNLLGNLGASVAPPASVPSLAVGTPMVYRSGLAMLHRGEAVVPANQVGRGSGGGGTTVINLTAYGSTPYDVLAMTRRAAHKGGRGR